MYNVLIVDDEKYVGKALELSIPWNALQLRLVDIALNLPSALKVINSSPIDIVITDIQMPGGTGLDLAKQLYEIDENIQVIIISGYADFQYAKEALQSGVVGYCVKPIDDGELLACLKKAISRLTKTKQPTGDFIDIIESSDYFYIKKHMLENEINPDHFYVATSINLGCLDNLLTSCITLKLGKNKYAYLSNNPFCKNSFPISTEIDTIGGIGLIATPTSSQNLRKRIMDSYLKSYQYFMAGQTTISESLPTFPTFQLITQFTLLINQKKYNDIEKMFTQIESMDIANTFTIQFAFTLFNLIMTSELFDHQDAETDNYFYDFDQLITEHKSFCQMLQFLKIMLQEFTSVGNYIVNSNRINANFLIILKYINQNYTEPLSLQNIADVLHLNPNYISQLFKKEAKTTYIKYVTNLRIEFAKKLLGTTNYTINEICEEVGFNDYFYFLKAFKKVTGISPTKYRTKE